MSLHSWTKMGEPEFRSFVKAQDARFRSAFVKVYPQFAPPPKKRVRGADALVELHKTSWREIVAEVAEKHGITVKDIIGRNRQPDVRDARNEACYRLNVEEKYSLPRIGIWLGGRDHTTILNSVRRHKAKLGVTVFAVKNELMAESLNCANGQIGCEQP